MASDSSESTPLLAPSTSNCEYKGIKPKVHTGYGTSRLPLKPSKAARHLKLLNQRAAQKSVQQGLVLPFSNNIGPGNTIQSARSNSDVIAQGHDLHYQDAKGPSDVSSADIEAVGQFVKEATGGHNPISQLQAVVGALGLGAKYAVEKLTGKVLYGKYVFTLS